MLHKQYCYVAMVYNNVFCNIIFKLSVNPIRVYETWTEKSKKAIHDIIVYLVDIPKVFF